MLADPEPSNGIIFHIPHNAVFAADVYGIPIMSYALEF